MVNLVGYKAIFVNPLAPNIFSAGSPGGIPVIAKPAVETEALGHIDAKALEGSFVYVHCTFDNQWDNMLIRIWKTTFLTDSASGTRSALVHAENITMAPQWTSIPDRVRYSFLLIFSGLPKSCRKFDLVEEIAEPGGFLIKDIMRNETDVYHIDVSSR